MDGRHQRMFISQATLEAWIDSGNVVLSERIVELKDLGCTYDLEPAVRFVAQVAGEEEPTLIGRVLGEARVHELGGELLGDSVLFGDTAFEIEAGYIGSLRER